MKTLYLIISLISVFIQFDSLGQSYRVLGAKISILENSYEEKPIAVIGNYEYFLCSEKVQKFNLVVGSKNYIQKRINDNTVNKIEFKHSKSSTLRFFQLKGKIVIVEERFNNLEQLKGLLIKMYDPFLRCIHETVLFNKYPNENNYLGEIQYLSNDDYLYVLGTTSISQSKTKVEIYRFDHSGTASKIDNYEIPLNRSAYKIHKAIEVNNTLNIIEQRTEHDKTIFALKNYNLTNLDKFEFPLDMGNSQYHLYDFEIEIKNNILILFGFSSTLVNSIKEYSAMILEFDIQRKSRIRLEIENIPNLENKTNENCSILTSIKNKDGSVFLIGEYKKYDLATQNFREKFPICDHSDFIIIKLNEKREIEILRTFNRFVSDVYIPFSNVLCNFYNGKLNILYYNNYALVLKKIDLNTNEETTEEIFKREHPELTFFDLSSYEKLSDNTYIIHAGLSANKRKLKVEF